MNPRQLIRIQWSPGLQGWMEYETCLDASFAFSHASVFFWLGYFGRSPASKPASVQATRAARLAAFSSAVVTATDTIFEPVWSTVAMKQHHSQQISTTFPKRN